MAKAWIHDKWLKSAQVTTADGHLTKMEPPPSAKHSLAMFADEPGKAKVPEEFKSKDYGKGARWEVRWRVDGTGRRKLFRYRADAEAFMAEIEDRIRSNRYTDPRDSCRPLSGVADLWQQGLTGTVKGSAEGRYRLELRYWVLPKRREDALKDITTVRIRHWYVELAEGTAPYAGKWDSGFLLSASSISSAGRNVLGSILDAAVENRWLETNSVAVAVAKVKAKVLYNRVVQRRIYLAQQEIKTIVEQMDVANTIVVYLLADTGCPSARPWPCG